jgi:hypothetical protein
MSPEAQPYNLSSNPSMVLIQTNQAASSTCDDDYHHCFAPPEIMTIVAD